ncbi:hypothetical protein PMAYCL1PPCAC_16491 [Pristionchus mayeri]|uniref:SET domain-containing protein n=1 Tax=Pristionchus mayeri TaxID=1317129 RepID=A0AAN5CKT9_9BILA|nr:hypothetical protein PMAYCL1PPCAC_16491 [Pristionchus mayeri]
MTRRSKNSTSNATYSLRASGNMKNTPQTNVAHLKCSSNCKTCGIKQRTGTVRYCCRLNESLELNSEGVPHFIESGIPERPCFFRVECTDECGCSVTRRANRIVQRGHQKPLLIFRHHIMEWSLRTLSSFDKDELITEYIGEILLERTIRRSQQYDLDLSYDAVREDGEKRPLVINAFTKGNEARFISTSCEPNAYFQTTVVERKGLCFNQGAIHATRGLVIGEEITIDYFGGKELGDEGMGHVPEVGLRVRFSKMPIHEGNDRGVQ